MTAGRDLLYEAFVVGAEPVGNMAVGNNIPSLVQKYQQLEAETESVKKTLADMDGLGAEKHLKAIERKEASMIRNLEAMRSKEGKLRHRVERQEKKPTFFGMGGGMSSCLMSSKYKLSFKRYDVSAGLVLANKE